MNLWGFICGESIGGEGRQPLFRGNFFENLMELKTIFCLNCLLDKQLKNVVSYTNWPVRHVAHSQLQLSDVPLGLIHSELSR